MRRFNLMKDFERKPTVGSEIIQGLTEFLETLEKKEPITDKFTCRVVELDLCPMPYDPVKVRRTRKLLHASQAVFARFLGVTVKAVQAWEHGINSPSKMACRFMDEIQRNPRYWIARLRESAKTK
jgi:putative transcriptional regulator